MGNEKTGDPHLQIGINVSNTTNLTSIEPIILPIKAVHIQCLDRDGRDVPGAFASGFITKEQNNCFLYTCWHVVTSYDMHELKGSTSPNQTPNRFALRVTLQRAKPQGPSVGIGGSQQITVPLYESTNLPLRPLWHQDFRESPHTDLNAIGLRVPLFFDAVKIPLPQDLQIDDLQVISESEVWTNGAEVTNQVFVVGFPYGYSSLGMSQPNPIVLAHHVASTNIEGRPLEILLDRPGAPGMSGGPVFVKKSNGIYLLGIYTGIIFPDSAFKRESVTSLGVCSNIGLCWRVWQFEPYKF